MARSCSLTSGPARPDQPLRKRKWWYAAVMAIVLLALTGILGALWFAVTTHKAPEPTLAAVPLSTYPGFQMNPSFSPDGNQVAFAWNGHKQDNFDIYVKLIATSGPPLRLTNGSASGL